LAAADARIHAQNAAMVEQEARLTEANRLLALVSTRYAAARYRYIIIKLLNKPFLCIKTQKRFLLVFLLSAEVLLEADPNEFLFRTFYVFFLTVCFLL
jgi:hypothetical protein